MATEVLSVSPTPDSQALHSALRRSYASTGSLRIETPTLASSPKRQSYIDIVRNSEQPRTYSPPSPAASDSTVDTSTAEAKTPDISLGTPSSSATSFNSEHSKVEDASYSADKEVERVEDISFPDYGGVQFYHQDQSLDTSSDERDASITTDTTISDSPLPTPTVADDSAITREPQQHVDYLSYEWREEDIWASWRHIVSQRKKWGERSRLENASWRTWAKSKYRLRTISPETLNWLKESDVTWLYGPLKPAETHPITSNQSEPLSQVSRSGSFVNKKPILKKRSMSEVMLQKSLSTSSLVQQAAASVQAQQGRPAARRSAFMRAQSDGFPSVLSSETPSRDPVDYFTSHSSSHSSTPCESQPKRHIRFDPTVDEVRAVEYKDDPLDEPENESDEDLPTPSDESSDDGVLMMRRKKRPDSRKDGRGNRSGSHNGRKMIEQLPPSTLKYRTDSPDVNEEQQHHTFGNFTPKKYGRLSPSPSTETLRPSNPSNNYLIRDDTQDDGNSSSWSFGASNPKSSLGSASSSDDEQVFRKIKGKKAKHLPPGPADYGASASGLRRTNSGMLMPYNEDEEDEMMAVGLFGRVSETINTARDIAHVIWNVGWRK